MMTTVTNPVAKATNAKETKMATATPVTPEDSKRYFAGLSFAALVAKQEEARLLVEQIEAALLKKREEEIKVLADAYVLKVKAAGFSVQEALDAVKLYLPVKAATGKGRAARGTAVAKGPRKDADSTGASPTPGASYKLADGTVWMKAANGKGAPKKEFLEVVKGGATWVSLKV